LVFEVYFMCYLFCIMPTSTRRQYIAMALSLSVTW
jgi:hypothetical protein